MKSICLAAAFSLGASAAFAGSLAEPEADIIVPAPVVVENDRGSLGGFVVPAVLAALLIAAAASSDSGGGS